MWLTVGNLHVKVTRATEAEVAWLRTRGNEGAGLTFNNRKTIYTTGEPELLRFFDLQDSTFPAGFLPGVVARAALARIPVQVIDSRQAPAQPIPRSVAEAASRLNGGAVWALRDYQVEAVEVGLAKTRGIIQIATGGGKTNVAIALVERLPTARWLFLVHRASLMAQAADRYEALTGRKAGRIGEGCWVEVPHFICATFQSLASALKRGERSRFFDSIEGLIVDEAHVLPAESYKRVADRLRNAYWRLGISATPLDREDQRSIFAVASLGPVIYRHSADALITAGHLARPVIRLVRVEQEFREVDTRSGAIKKWDWRKVYEEGVVKSKLRNRVLLAAVAKAEKPCLVFVKEIAHGRAFTKALEARGAKVEFIWGNASLYSRQQAVRRLVRGDVEVLVSSVIFQEGVDIPELRSVVIASAGKSVIATLQRIGRGMRLSKGKDSFQVWDVADEGNAWLARHSNARRLAYQRERYVVQVVDLAPSLPTGQQLRLTFAEK